MAFTEGIADVQLNFTRQVTTLGHPDCKQQWREPPSLDSYSPYNTENQHTKNSGDRNGDDSFPSCGMPAASTAVRRKREKRCWWRSRKERERSWGRMCCWMGRIHTVLIGLGAASFLEEGAAIQPQIWMPQARDVAQLLYELPSLCEDFGPIAIIV